MPFSFVTNNRLISRWDGSNFQEEVLTLSGADGVAVSSDSSKFTISGNQTALSGALQTDINSRVLRAGDTMTGLLTLSADPTASGHAATKQYVDAAAASAVSSGSSALTTYSGFASSAYVDVAGDSMTGFLTLNADPTASGHASTKQYVDAAAAAAAASGSAGSVMVVEEANGLVYSGAIKLDFGHAIDVTSGTGEAGIAVDESEFTSVVFLTGDQIVSGNKTFANNVVVQGDLAVSGTLITTEELLVEDHVVTLNSTVTGTPSLDAGVKVERGSSTDALLLWNETTDRWEIGLSGSLSAVLTDANSATFLDADYVNVGGDTMTGFLILNADPTASGHAATKQYVDAAAASAVSSGSSALTTYSGFASSAYVDVAGDSMTGFLTLNADPTASGHASTKQYVDAAAAAAAASGSAGSVMVVEEANGLVYSGAIKLDFGHAIDVTSGTGEAGIAVDESEFTSVVFLTGNQTISGTKTFASPVILAAGTEPASISDTGTAGEFRWSDDYLYICVATDSWKRVALAQF